MKTTSYHIKAVMFDFDGTLTHPGAIDFPEIKKQVGCPAESLLLEYILNQSDINRKETFLNILNDHELQAAAESIPNQGAENLIQGLKAKGLKVGIISRNSRASILRALDNFQTIGLSDFDIIITRDDPVEPKPNGNGLILAARRLNAPVEQLMMVGDYHLDIQAGNHAGAVTVYLTGPDDPDAPDAAMPSDLHIDFSIQRLAELTQIIDRYVLLPAGKFPNRLLEKTLNRFDFDDPSLLVHPGIGEDIAAVALGDENVMILKSDPITFATPRAGYSAVLINANDIATSGGIPRWFLTTLLFPVQSTPHDIESVISEIYHLCRRWGITLCGGHTEITDSVARPVICGMMVGTVHRNRLLEKRNMAAGDRILLTKGIALEGTAIIAGEFEKDLLEKGMSRAEIDEARGLDSSISIIKDARIAADTPGTTAMHDITEGGIATALEELSVAGRHRIQVDIHKIPIHPLTRKICGIFKIDPLGLIASGGLLICSRERSHQTLMGRLAGNNIGVACIGRVLDPGQGIEAYDSEGKAEWPRFETDELTRLY